MRDNAIFRHTIPDRGHPERMRSAPRGGTAAEGADIPPPGNSACPDLHQARKIGAAWADPGCALVPPLVWFSLSGAAPWVPFFSPFPPFRGWLSGVLGGSPARVDHDDVEAPPPFPVWDDLPGGANRDPVDFA